MNGRIQAMGLIALAVASFQGEHALAQSSPSSQDVADGHLRPTTAALDLEWNVTPGYEFPRHRFIGYTVLIYGLIGMTPVRITDSNGYTANNPFGARYLLLDNLLVDFDARDRYVRELVSDHGQGLNTAETTFGHGYRFR
jgi:hypothetical protein